MKNMVKMQINLPISFLKEGSYYVAYTPALDLSSSGKTLDEAEKMFAEAVKLFFEELDRMGTTETVLTQLGWKKVKREWRSPTPIAQRMAKLQVAGA